VRLVRQFQSQLFNEQLGVWGRLGVAGQNQPTLIDRRNPHIDLAPGSLIEIKQEEGGDVFWI